VGTTIEWYDFLIYSTMTGLVFGKVFFSGSDPLIDTLKAFGVFFIGFVARPIGAAIFGHYGDRIGRKATLSVTLLMTGIATAAVGLVPGYDMIGIWGAVHPDPLAPDPRDRCRRRMGRLGLAGDGMGAQQQEPWVHRLLAPILNDSPFFSAAGSA
jgi:MFS family permease